MNLTNINTNLAQVLKKFPVAIVIGFLGLLAGMIIDWIGFFVLLIFMGLALDGADATGIETIVYRATFSLIALLGLSVAGVVSLAVARYWSQSAVLSFTTALILMLVVYVGLASPVSVMNECSVGVAFPIPVGGCD